jgi:hypothetical protein
MHPAERPSAGLITFALLIAVVDSPGRRLVVDGHYARPGGIQGDPPSFSSLTPIAL